MGIAPNFSHASRAASHPPAAPGRVPAAAGPRVLLYSHDTYGLGNIRRTLLLAEAVREAAPKAEPLVVTGSPMVHAFRMPPGVDYIKLPTLERVAADQYEARVLTSWTDALKRVRSEILENIARAFTPNLVIVDKRPSGVDGELTRALATLDQMRPRPRMILGVRDILDTPERTRKSLRQHHWFDIIERYYDEVWIYGQPEVFDPITEYAFPPSVAARTRFCGYLARTCPRPATQRRPHHRPHIVVTTGGGGDGSRMIGAYLEGLAAEQAYREFDTTVILGPEMPPGRRTDLLARFARLPRVEFLDFDAEPTQRYAAADVVVSMAGYNTACELLAIGVPAILVPRCEPVAEQLIRARRLCALGLADSIEPADLTPQTVLARVRTALARSRSSVPATKAIHFGGADLVRQCLRAMLAPAEQNVA